MTVTKPNGNTMAPIILIKPGAFSWYHGAVKTVNETAHPKERIHPPEIPDKKTLSGLDLPFFTPALQMSSAVSAGE
ncbi:unnamed protein product [Fusarium graminearum]|uniref:Chromosome 4, complete genome n=1 Tax=Gibberella zeae (strain ATCC MYA-4620 / CBS 123657 / FGSC 9075 / NRRL 31084 / PH-1) TaxID=229533 RepID=A0A098DV60_GIBZE|nr:unnamed protein product [Fusarium graminearum]CAG1995090.1 unnamed protein product [Fusarium graminearum]CAG2007251.1 unnamed protein product [Fusarium graminearum]CEF84733.1 unnamed protein product [Fusarium graminearum]CZS74764.1 unnamed protein product [Fusarium graminearum]